MEIKGKGKEMNDAQRFLLKNELDDRHHEKKLTDGLYTSDIMILWAEEILDLDFKWQYERERDLRLQQQRSEARYTRKIAELEETIKRMEVNKWISVKNKEIEEGWYLAWDGITWDKMLYKNKKWIAQTKRELDPEAICPGMTRDDMTEYVTHYYKPSFQRS